LAVLLILPGVALFQPFSGTISGQSAFCRVFEIFEKFIYDFVKVDLALSGK